MSHNIVSTNFTTKILREELRNVKSNNSPIEVIYENVSYQNATWFGIITAAFSHDCKFYIKTEPPDDNNSGYSVQDLMNEINGNTELVYILFSDNALSNNIILHEFRLTDKETTMFLLGKG